VTWIRAWNIRGNRKKLFAMATTCHRSVHRCQQHIDISCAIPVLILDFFYPVPNWKVQKC